MVSIVLASRAMRILRGLSKLSIRSPRSITSHSITLGCDSRSTCENGNLASSLTDGSTRTLPQSAARDLVVDVGARGRGRPWWLAYAALRFAIEAQDVH